MSHHLYKLKDSSRSTAVLTVEEDGVLLPALEEVFCLKCFIVIISRYTLQAIELDIHFKVCYKP